MVGEAATLKNEGRRRRTTLEALISSDRLGGGPVGVAVNMGAASRRRLEG